jgi:hypothetical protein
MYYTPDVLSQLGGILHLYFREQPLCEDCERDLMLARQSPPDPGLSFVGPFMIRRAEGYCVASLLGYDAIIGAPTPSEFDWRKALRGAKTLASRPIQKGSKTGGGRAPDGGAWTTLYDRPAKDNEPDRLKQDIAVLSKAASDPSPNVRRAASWLLERRQAALEALSR